MERRLTGRRAGLRGPRLPAARGAFGPLLVAALLSADLAGPPRPLWAQWTQDPGRGWADLTLYHHDTKEEFGPDGEIQPLFADGHSITTSLFFTGVGGIVPGLDAWLQIPIHRLQYDDAAGERDKTGVGDTRLFLRASPRLVGLATFPVALRGGVKIPGAEFPVDPQTIPLSEGQVDWELILELGHSFHPAPLYVAGWVGYRWRTLNEKTFRKPGDERFAYLAVGGDLGPLLVWKTAGEWLYGLAPVVDRVELPTAARRLFQVLPLVGLRLGPGNLQLGGRIPVSGRNMPSGIALVAGYFTSWGFR